MLSRLCWTLPAGPRSLAGAHTDRIPRCQLPHCPSRTTRMRGESTGGWEPRAEGCDAVRQTFYQSSSPSRSCPGPRESQVGGHGQEGSSAPAQLSPQATTPPQFNSCAFSRAGAQVSLRHRHPVLNSSPQSCYHSSICPGSGPGSQRSHRSRWSWPGQRSPGCPSGIDPAMDSAPARTRPLLLLSEAPGPTL